MKTNENKYTILENNNHIGDKEQYAIIKTSCIENVMRHDVYNRYGQKDNGGIEAWGQFSIFRNGELETNLSWEELTEEEQERAEAFPEYSDLDTVPENEEHILIETCKAIEYYDGSNFQTIILDNQYRVDTEWKIVEDEKFINDVLKQFENHDTVNYQSGTGSVKTADYVFYYSNYSDSWPVCFFEEK